MDTHVHSTASGARVCSGAAAEKVLAVVAIASLLVFKRLTANWEPIPQEYGVLRVLAFRILWDRDVPKRVEWTNRRPQ